MNNIISIWKPVGMTPLEAIQLFKEKKPEHKFETISYAGRLDPMAEGILLLLIGDENKNREKYLGLDKAYESEIIFGVSTDTFGSLGLITEINIKKLELYEIKSILKKFIGKQNQIYPPYSSRTVKGKPLYWWARKNKLNDIEIPKHIVEIYSIKLIKLEKINAITLTNNLIKKVKWIDGDFRQKEIIKNWERFSQENSEKELIKINLLTKCSAGTYIRRLADDLGKELGTSAFASSIKRLSVGSFNSDKCLMLD